PRAAKIWSAASASMAPTARACLDRVALDCLWIQLETQTRTIRIWRPHPVLRLWKLGKHDAVCFLGYPQVLDDFQVRCATCQVEVYELHRVRGDWQVERVRQVRHLQPFRHAADAPDIRLHDVSAA